MNQGVCCWWGFPASSSRFRTWLLKGQQDREPRSLRSRACGWQVRVAHPFLGQPHGPKPASFFCQDLHSLVRKGLYSKGADVIFFLKVFLLRFQAGWLPVLPSENDGHCCLEDFGLGSGYSSTWLTSCKHHIARPVVHGTLFGGFR